MLGIGFATALPEISVPRGRNFRPKDVTVHTSSDLEKSGTVVRKLISVTDPARTILDLGRYIKGNALRDVIEDARRLELADWPDLIACLANHARKGRHGITRLREAIADGARNAGITDTGSELIALSHYEIDGTVHLDPVQRSKDEARDHELRTVYGWIVRRIWWEIPVYQPREFVRIIRETLRLVP